MFKSIDNAMQNPANHIGDPAKAAEFTSRFNEATKKYKAFKELEELTPIARLKDMDETQYTNWVDGIIKPGKYHSLKLIEETMGESGANVVRDMFFTKVVAGKRKVGESWSNTVEQEFNKFTAVNDNKTLDFLMPKKERDQLVDWARTRDRLESGELASIAKHQENSSVTAIELATMSSAEHVKKAIVLAGGKNSDLGKVIQQGFIQHLLNHSRKSIDKVGEGINVQAFFTMFDSYMERGTAQEILSPEVLDFIQKGRDYLRISGQAPDVGGQMIVGSTGSQVVQAPFKMGKAVAEGKGLGSAAKIGLGIAGRIVSFDLQGKYIYSRAAKLKDEAAASWWKSVFDGGAMKVNSRVKEATIFMNHAINEEQDRLDLEDKETFNVNQGTSGPMVDISKSKKKKKKRMPPPSPFTGM
jgi:hypothetical protein